MGGGSENVFFLFLFFYLFIIFFFFLGGGGNKDFVYIWGGRGYDKIGLVSGVISMQFWVLS